MKAVVRVAAFAGLVALVLVMVAPAEARGGTWLQPVRDRYEPGDVATLVAYDGVRLPTTLTSAAIRTFLVVGDERVPTGDLVVAGTGLGSGWQSLRFSLTFTIPADLAPGRYEITYCVDPCGGQVQVAGIVGGYLFVGTDPDHAIARSWPIGEPEIGNLPDDAAITGPGYEITARDLRAGAIPEPSLRTP
ncbi:MAG: hypothetical protein ACRD2W_14620, partial [Acidimicrobiales bacterium]